jgi:serine/threonine protein kinase/tetratricopeptide (TPR) repeat protein
MSLTSGSTLGGYQVLSLLGSGGMGEVYRARDLKLNREVALKVLPESAANDPDRLARFKREAQVLASLNHPCIAAIYGFEDSGQTQALVLELVEGPTLAERIAAGSVSVDEALSIGAQIAEALEAAGEQGVIHRDLKPANIKLRPDGTVKVLDFGLAKLIEPPSVLSAEQLAETHLSVGTTRLGAIVGTPAYMSPEQARGQPVGKQSDIWALGCVLFELLSGRPVFGGSTPSDSIARVLEREPDWRALPASTPPRIRELLERCLRKDQQQRLHDVADARIEIADARVSLLGARRRDWRWPTIAAIAAAVLVVGGIGWLTSRIPASPAESETARHDAVSVIISDFDNLTKESVFDGTLEPMLRIVLEGAPFINAYDRSAVARSLDVRPPDKFDQDAARMIAIKQGLAVVLAGRIARDGTAYAVSVTAVRAINGDSIHSSSASAANKDEVLGVATELVTRIRRALGDDVSDTSRRFAADTISATSLEVVRDYAAAMEALSRGKFDEALRSFAASVDRDPKFGMAWAGRAIASRNVGRQADAEKFIREAVRHVEGMTERERYRTRGLFYFITGDYQQCVAGYSELIDRYEADVAARNNLALCLTYLRKMAPAMEQIRRVVELLPNRALYRVNLSLYSTYSGDFAGGEREALVVQEQSPWGVQALALAQLGAGRITDAAATFERYAQFEDLGPAFGASGLADVALYQGKFSEAATTLKRATSADSSDRDRAAWNFAALARAEAARGQTRAALEAVDRALANSKAVKIRFLSALVLVDATEFTRALELATGLSADLQAESQSYGRIIEGLVALGRGDSRTAIKILTEAVSLLDTWIAHFSLGRANLEAGAFVQADAEFDRCIRRRGESVSLFLDEEATSAFLPPAYYYQGRARDGMSAAGAAESYRTYLAIRGGSTEDPLVKSARQLMKP